MTSQTLMVDFPAVIKSKVLEKLDVFSILKLRKVCWNLREFIDQQPPKFTSGSVKVTTSPRISFDTGISIIVESPNYGINTRNQQKETLNFRPDRNGCIMEWEKDYRSCEKVLEKENYVDVFLREFEIIMKYHWRPVLDSFSIDRDEDEEEEENEEEDRDDEEEGDEEEEEDEQEEGGEEEDGVGEEEDEENDIRMVNFQKIKQLDQWKNSKHVEIDFVYSFNIQDFLHFEEVEIVCLSMPVRNILSLKEKFLASSTLTCFDVQIRKIGYSLRERIIRDRIGIHHNYLSDILHPSFGSPSLPVTWRYARKIWFFRIPDSEKEIVELTAIEIEDGDHFIFRRIKIQDVPEGAVIKD